MSESTFINYRRDDTGPEAKLIANALCSVLPREAVFLDSQTIDTGDEWPERIQSALFRSTYVLVLIGSGWLIVGMDQWGRRRIDAENDWVRQEIAHALRDIDKTVIPILLGGAEMPPADVLPKEISQIVFRQHVTLRRDYWEHDLNLLVARVVPNHSLKVSAEENPVLKPIWNRIDGELKKILMVAATLAETEGKHYISTTNFVRSLMFLRPGGISDFFVELPDGALPETNAQDITIQGDALQKLDSFSPCINSALSNLAPKISNTESLSSEDIFIDIARYASGKSTQRLRCHGVSKEDVEKIVKQLGWKLVERDVE